MSALPPASTSPQLGSWAVCSALSHPRHLVWTEQPWLSPEWDCDGFPLPPQIRSVIRRSRETGHAHPMSREPSPRRRLDPATLSRTPSQERLIAELQGRLGIQLEAEEATGVAGASAEDWRTEGVVITVQPRGRRAGGQLVEKVASSARGWARASRHLDPPQEGRCTVWGKEGGRSPAPCAW